MAKNKKIEVYYDHLCKPLLSKREETLEKFDTMDEAWVYVEENYSYTDDGDGVSAELADRDDSKESGDMSLIYFCGDQLVAKICYHRPV